MNFYVLCLISHAAYNILISFYWRGMILVYQVYMLFIACFENVSLSLVCLFVLCFGSLPCTEITEPVLVYVYWLCQLFYISVHRCHCWQVCVTFLLCLYFCFHMFKFIKKGYYVLEFFIGVGNRDIVSPRADLKVINSQMHEEKEEITKPPTR